MDFNILEFTGLFQNITPELHHSEHYNHLDSSLSTQFFTFKLKICVKRAVRLLMFAESGHVSVQREMCICFVQVYAWWVYTSENYAYTFAALIIFVHMN